MVLRSVEEARVCLSLGLLSRLPVSPAVEQGSAASSSVLWKQRFGAHLMEEALRVIWASGRLPQGLWVGGEYRRPSSPAISTHNHWNLSLLGWTVLLSSSGGSWVECSGSLETGSVRDRFCCGQEGCERAHRGGIYFLGLQG